MNVPNLILTEDAVADMMSNKKLSSPVVQVLSYKILSAGGHERIRVLISDGKYSYSLAMFATKHNQRVTHGGMEPNTVIRIDKYSCNVVGEKIVLVILDLTVLAQGADVGHKIGNPIPYISPAEPQNEEAANVPIPDLTEGAIAAMMSNMKLNSPVVQVLSYKIISGGNPETERIRVLISDGKYHYSLAMFATKYNQMVTEGGMEPNTIIRIDKYSCNVVGEKILLVILDLTVLAQGADAGHKIGNPVAQPHISPAEPQNEELADVPIPDLTESAIADFMSNRKVNSPIVQILDYRGMSNDGRERFRFLISDGKYSYHFVMLATQHNHMVTAGHLEPSTVIRIDKYVIRDIEGRKVLKIVDLTVLAQQEDVGYRIGNPISISELAMP